MRSLGSKYWKRRVRKQANLFEYRGLIPVDALVRQLAIAKADNHDERNIDMATGRRYTGKLQGIPAVWVKEKMISSTS